MGEVCGEDYDPLTYNISFNTIVTSAITSVDIIQTFPNGTTIECGTDSHGNHVHRICSRTGAMCRYAEPHHVAMAYAQQYEDYYAVKKEEDSKTTKPTAENG